MKRLFESLQKMGRALMLPIAVLPVAGLLLRLGQADLLDLPMVAAAGAAIFSNLGLLFAAGVAVGLARENHGAAGLAAIVGYLVTTEGAASIIAVPPEVLAGLSEQGRELATAAFKDRQLGKLSVPAGILSGVVAGWLYNRYHDIKLPDYLAFFGGRRFIPIASGFCGLAGAAAFGLGWPILETGMNTMSRAVLDAGEIGLFAYGLLNRVLIVTGLHHIANNVAWFLLGDFNGITGDLNRFFAGDPEAGIFMAGFFPVMMFGLPAACLAMYRTALPERRLAVGGLLFSMALTSFLTGVTEPIEFTFMFLAPGLYVVHAVLTGTSMALMDILGVRLGFGFSAGLFDYLLNFNIATRPLLLIPVGAAYFAIYYVMFRFFIVRFNLPTPGREPVSVGEASSLLAGNEDRTASIVAALGGAGNITSLDACTTRLRLTVVDETRVDAGRLKELGAHGVIRPTANAVQVVVGPVADQLAGGMRDYIGFATGREAGTAGSASPDREARKPGALPQHLYEALGGKGNLRRVESLAGRLRIEVADRGKVDEENLSSPDVKDVVWISERVAHFLTRISPTGVAHDVSGV
jgi:N-acetylglucosamine PTS system EIICBA or EIICB component